MGIICLKNHGVIRGEIVDSVDKKLLNILQEGIPLEKDPYQRLGDNMGISRIEVLSRIENLKKKGYIRRLGGTFDTRQMGYESMLIGASVGEESFEEVADYLNSIDTVTHNYKRAGKLNMWFTLATKSKEERREILNFLKENFKIEEVLEFPRIQSFKLKVFFDMKG